MTASKLDVQNGFELLQLLLLKHAPKSTDRTVGHMNTLRMTYVDARRADIVGNHSDWANKLSTATRDSRHPSEYGRIVPQRWEHPLDKA